MITFRDKTLYFTAIFVPVLSLVAQPAIHWPAQEICRLILYAVFILVLFEETLSPVYLKKRWDTNAITGLFAAFTALGVIQYAAGIHAGVMFPIGSADPLRTREYTIQFFTYGLYYWICLRFFKLKKAFKVTSDLYVGIAALIMIWGVLINPLIGSAFQSQPPHSSAVSGYFGPFNYENIYGGLVLLLFPLMAAGLWNRYHGAARRGRSGRLTQNRFDFIASFIENGGFFYLTVCLFSLLCVFLAQARLASLILTGALVFAVSLALIRRKRIFLWIVMSLFMVSAGLMLINNTSLKSTYDPDDLAMSAHKRTAMLEVSGKLFQDRPVFGWGLGTFAGVSERYMPDHADSPVHRHAYNEYLELLVETGLAGFMIMAAGLFLILSPARQRALRLKHAPISAEHLAVLTSIGLFLMLSLCDYSLKTHGLAYLLVMQLALVRSEIFFNLPEGRNDHQDLLTIRRSVRERFTGYFMFLLMVILIAACSYYSLAQS